MPRRKDNWLGPLPEGKFPHANGEHLSDAPLRCGRCGGPWQRCDEGWRCMTCSNRWRAADCLRAMTGAQFHAEALGSLRIHRKPRPR